MIKIFLSFDFYGAGNVGDDLMLDGFLKEMKSSNIEFYCSLPRDPNSQKIRFPEINFVSREDRVKAADICNIWIGVGDTPIQIKSGNWFLDHLLKESELKKGKKIKYYFIGVGAESEAVTEKANFKAVLDEIDHIWTRDKATTDTLIKGFDLQADRITTSSDLANISLRKIFLTPGRNEKNKYDIGLCYFDENAESVNLDAVKIFLKNAVTKNKRVLAFGNEVRKEGKYEYMIYMNMFNRFERLFGNIKYYQPDYYNMNNVADLVHHYSKCEVIMSSRFHSLLTAAWAGCKVVALERSSKVSALAEDLGINEVKKPFTPEKLMLSYNESAIVDINILNRFHEQAVSSIESLKKQIFI